MTASTSTTAPAQNAITAIDILLEPDSTMIQHAQADNARLLKNFPKGYSLGGQHAPHISVLQRYVNTADLDKIFAAAAAVFAKEDPTSWKLKAFKYYYIPSGPIGLGGPRSDHRRRPCFVKPEERIAVFDNDGTLWSEQPFYFQLAFVLDRMKAMAPQHPEWKDNPLYTGVLAGDLKTMAAGGLKGVLEIAMVTHAGMTTEEFSKIVADWIESARHPNSISFIRT